MTVDLATTLGRVEHDALEFKSDMKDRNAIREAICAFSNDLPGRGASHLVNGNSEPEFTITPSYWGVTIRAAH